MKELANLIYKNNNQNITSNGVIAIIESPKKYDLESRVMPSEDIKSIEKS